MTVSESLSAGTWCLGGQINWVARRRVPGNRAKWQWCELGPRMASGISTRRLLRATRSKIVGKWGRLFRQLDHFTTGLRRQRWQDSHGGRSCIVAGRFDSHINIAADASHRTITKRKLVNTRMQTAEPAFARIASSRTANTATTVVVRNQNPRLPYRDR